MWNEREDGADRDRSRPAYRRLANPPFAATNGACMGRLKGDAKAKAAARKVRAPFRRASMAETATSRICRAARRSTSRSMFRVRGLSMGDLHFSQGDGEITFCGAIEMAGWLHHQGRVSSRTAWRSTASRTLMFKPSPMTPNYKDYLIFEGISVDEAGKQHYLDVHDCLSSGMSERHRVSQKVRLFRCTSLFHSRNSAGARATYRAS